MDFKPFKVIRPRIDIAHRVSAPPYDVLDYNKASELAKDEYNIVHVTRSEVNFEKDVDAYDKKVYLSARETLDVFLEQGILEQEDKSVYYIYRETAKNRSQTGIVGVISTSDYEKGNIKKHELTLAAKEIDRINHFYHCKCHTESVFLFHEKNDELNQILLSCTNGKVPIIDFVDKQLVRQELFSIRDEDTINKIEKCFQNMGSLYIADGHHRTESAYKVGAALEEEFGKEGEYSYLLATIFPEDDMNIMAYNRIVRDLNGLSEEEFLDKIKKDFLLEEINVPIEPTKKHEFTMILGTKYYRIIPKPELAYNKGPVEQLDVSIIGKYVLDNILGIKDLRTDNRIEFYGGYNAIYEIEERIKKDMTLAFILYPVDAADIRQISNEGLIMPPKSTWFEPKISSGLFMHKF